MALDLSSPAFSDGSDIPSRYTCDGVDVSPPLVWVGVPDDTRSLALIVDDPDAPDPLAPTMTWGHWVLYNLPPVNGKLPENVADADLPAGTLQGLNDWNRTGYGGPCPPIGRHRYRHRLYALDTVLPDLNQPSAIELHTALAEHIIDHCTLVGYFKR